AVRFDASRLEVHGEPVAVIEGVRRGTALVTGAAVYDLAADGTLMYVAGPAKVSTDQRDLAIMDRQGILTPLKLPPAVYVSPRVSPDGRRVAVDTDNGREGIVWVYDDLAGTTELRRLTFGGNNRSPVWSRDGTRVAYQSDREGDAAIFWQSM